MAEPRPGGGFDWARLSAGTKALLVTGLLMLISLFLPWRTIEGCEDAAVAAVVDVPCSEAGIAGLGMLVALLAIALVVWEGLAAAGVQMNVGLPTALVGAGLGAGTALFALLKFLLSLGGGPFDLFNVSWGAFVGLLVALGVAYGAYVRFQESKLGPAGPAA